MRRLSIILGVPIIGAILIVISMLQWNAKLETTAKKAQENLTAAAEENLPLTEKKQTDSDHSTNIENSPDKSTNSVNQNTDHPTAATDDPVIQQKEDNVNAEPENNDNSNNTASSEPTLSDIKSDYRRAFSDLEIQATSNLDQLLVQAKADSVSGKLSKAELVAKYKEDALVLERSADTVFNALYNQLEADLKKYNYDLNEALEFRTEYNKKKQARQSRLINQLKNF